MPGKRPVRSRARAEEDPLRPRTVFVTALAILLVVVVFAAIRLGTVSPPSSGGVESLVADAPDDAPGAAPRPPAVVVRPAAGTPGAGASGANPAPADPPDDSPAGRLVAAAKEGDTARVRELLAEGVPADAESGGYVALHRAAESGSVAVLEVLFAAGADVEAVDRVGNTPLSRAAIFGRADAVSVLLEAGADPNAHAEPNNQTALLALLFGWSVGRSPNPLGIEAREEERFAAARALLAAGADPHLAPGHIAPAMLAQGIGGEIMALLAGGDQGSGARPR